MVRWRVLREPLYPEPISPLIYGDFVEFLNDLVPGMWAERLQDRCFEGCLQPKMLWRPEEDWTYPRWVSFATGWPAWDRCPTSLAELEAPRPRVSLVFEQYMAYAGRQTAWLEVERGDDRPFVAGVAQHNVAVRAGERLRFEVFALGQLPEPSSVHVLLGRDYGAFFRRYASLEIQGIGQQWRRYTGTLTSDVTDAHATLAIGITSPGTLYLDKASLMPEDNLDGWRPDVVQAIRELKPGIIRFGGSSLIFYQWQNGIGPRDRRAPFENRPWGNREENDVGLHEFLRFCELVDAEPLICLNSNSTTVQQVLEEIEYCNGPADSRFGAIRAAMGHPEPFNVRYWQIGNEQGGAEYERILVEYAQAIRQHHPDLVLLASYPSDRLVGDLSDMVDYVCPHFYDPHTPQMEQELRALIARIRREAVNKDLKLGVTEWNHTSGQWGPARAWLLTLYNALNAGRMLNMYQRQGDMVRIANRSNMTNSECSGILQTSPTDIYFTPCYYVQKAYANLSGDRALRVDLGAEEELDVSATCDVGTGETVLAVVNCSGKVQHRTIDLSDLGLTQGQVLVWTLTGPAPDAINSFEDKRLVAPVETMETALGDVLDHAFVPYSVTILRCRSGHGISP